MQTLHRLLFPIALCSLALLARSQVDANSGRFEATGGMLAVDAATAGAVPGRLLVKDAGYYTTTPTERAPVPGAPDFRAATMLFAQPQPPTGPVEIDAFSIGMDWIVSGPDGQCYGPEGRWAVLLFSVTRGTTGIGSGLMAVEREATGSLDGAAGDLFCYEFTGTATGSLLLDEVTKALDSTTINIHPAAGTSNMNAFDYFASLYANADFRDLMPRAPTVFFSVSTATAGSIPLPWCKGIATSQSGATVFKTTWRPNSESWSPPTVYLSPSNLSLGTGDDVDALCVDLYHHLDNYVLFSTVSPAPGTAIRFYNRTTGLVSPYRYANGGPTIESRLGLGVAGGGDVDAMCAIDPGADELIQTSMAVDAIVSPGVWPISPSVPAPSNNPLNIYVARKPGSSLLHAYSSSNNLSNTLHRWRVRLPDNPGGPVFLPPTIVSRQPTWKGWPSQFTFPMSPSMLDRRLQFGVEEINTLTMQSVSSRFVEMPEWGERELTLTAPMRYASAEGSFTQNVWRHTPNRVQCLYDTTNFTNQGVVHLMQIDELEWREAGGSAGATITYPSVNLYLGYAQTDYLSPSTTFSNNRTGSHTLVYSGQVQVVKAWSTSLSTSPNKFSIRVPLQNPFIYDPTLGQDLLLEIEIMQAPSPAAFSSISSSYDSSLHAANTVRSVGTTGSSTGAISPFCPVCRFGYSIPPAAAVTKSYGHGCYDEPVSFYETFLSGSFDLSGSPVQSILLTPANGAYVVSAGSNNWYTPQSASLNLTDDSLSHVFLPQSFAYPTRTGTQFTSQLTICSNGFVTLNGSSVNVSYIPSPEYLLADEPRYCPCWADLLPNPANNVYAESVGSMYYVTWLNVPTYTPSGVVTMQLAMDLSAGTVEYRYQSCQLPTLSLVGWSPGISAVAPDERDLSFLPFSTLREQPALLVSGLPRAVTGTTVTYTISNIHPAAFFSALMQNIGGSDPGIHLGILGMPACRLFVDFPPPVMTVLFGSPATLQFNIPNSPSLTGTEVDNQAAAFIAGVNPFGAVTSNGLVTRVGTL